MTHLKYIYWRDDYPRDASNRRFANIHYLIGYCPQTISAYRKMLDEVRKTFPGADEESVHCHQVRKSDRCNGFTILTWNSYIPEGEYDGWNQVKDGRVEYYW